MRDPQPAPAPGFEQRVVVATFTYPWEAEVARARLVTDGVPAVLADAHLIRLDWFVAQAVGGVKVLVAASDAERAASLLAATAELPEVGLATEGDRPADPLCPGCHSSNLSFERWSRAGFVGSLLLLGFPVPIPQPRWRCGRCKEVWRPEQLA